MGRILAWMCLVFTPAAFAIQGHIFAADMGFAVPQLFFAEASVHIFHKWELGIGYGFFPSFGALSEGVTLPKQSTSLQDGRQYFLYPTVTPSFSTLNPFIRFYPTETKYYIQLAYPMLKTKVSISSGLEDFAGKTLSGAILTGDMTLTQGLPTIGVGYYFTSQLYLINLSIGLTFYGHFASSIEIGGTLPDTVGGISGNQEQIDQLEGNISDEINEIVKNNKGKLPLLPAFFLSFGVYY